MFQQVHKAVVVGIHKTISTLTFASAVKSQLRTQPARLPKDSGRSAPSAPPKGKNMQKILQLHVPMEQQKPKYQPSAGPKSSKDRRPLGKHSIVLHPWPWRLRILYPQSGEISSPPAARGSPPPPWSALPPPPNPKPLPNSAPSPPPLAEKPQGPLPSCSPPYPSTPFSLCF
ncbi:hypothetical protein PoB_007331400 [Plakobranchus ocellatus]|uniref:Uncharacterized protein n=1 Tax=Plakobranchus ocellatus TaxID=259542 RepID=A0AAV4DRG5_9GAST|nr:hypothetical protein PoB_007331400 [Plakobranchus ocellatus]